jgi:ADP-ribosylglycohydrolase
LFHCKSFEEGLLSVVNAGGDADTNAAVACSLLGAKFGYSAIPSKYIENLAEGVYLQTITNNLINFYN